jgi:cytochrome c oxidase cbb3-type subunit 3
MRPPDSTCRLTLLCAWAACLAFGLTGCEREQRRFRPTPPTASPEGAVTESPIQPGPPVRPVTVKNLYEENAYATSEGKRLYNQYNCSGCHFQGGGGIGPPLMDDEWIYGSEPENIFATIVEGRPNGMPSFRGRLSNYQIWQLVAYVRSLSGLTPKAARPGRDDALSGKDSEQRKKPERPKNSALPKASETP